MWEKWPSKYQRRNVFDIVCFFAFHKGSNKTISTKNICVVRPNALNFRKYQRLFSKFRYCNFDLSDSYWSGRSTILDNLVLKAEEETDPRQTTEEVSNKLYQLWSIIQKHLQQISKLCWVFWPHIICPKQKRLTDSSHAIYWFKGTTPQHFFSLDHWR